MDSHIHEIIHEIIHEVVAALIRRDDGAILLVRQQGPDDPEPAWALPGGVVEAGERLDEAFTREVREETGLDVASIGPLLSVAQSHNPAGHLRGEAPPTTVWLYRRLPDDTDTVLSRA